MITLFITFDYIDNKNISDQIFFDSINKLKESNFLLVNKYYQKGILELQRMKTDLMKKRESLCLKNNLNQFKCREYLEDFYTKDNRFLKFIDGQLRSGVNYDNSNFLKIVDIKNYYIYNQSLIIIVIISFLLSYLSLLLFYFIKLRSLNS